MGSSASKVTAVIGRRPDLHTVRHVIIRFADRSYSDGWSSIVVTNLEASLLVEEPEEGLRIWPTPRLECHIPLLLASLDFPAVNFLFLVPTRHFVVPG